MTGLVFDLSRGCVDDGPGYRTVVFLKGCALDCPWCHNPEGKSFGPEIAFDTRKCLSCGACETACPRTWKPGWRPGCTACGKCAAACPSGARRLAGREFTVDALVEELLADAAFFSGTGGGVTLSGGEPMARPDFLFACVKRLRSRGVHVAVETAGFFLPRLAKRLTREAGLVLFDLKHSSAEKFRDATGKDNSNVLENLETILASKVPVELRITLVPGFNDSEADLKAIAEFLKGMPRIPPVTLLPFHRLAVSKQALFDRPYRYADARPPTKAELETARRTLAAEKIDAS